MVGTQTSVEGALSSDLLVCPIRGRLTTPERAADGLVFSEEKRRIDALRYLLSIGYPPSHFLVETTLLKFGHGGKNALRVDFAVYDKPAAAVAALPLEERLARCRLIAEIKRDHKDATLAKQTQVFPALSRLPDLEAVAVYWDDLEHRFFFREVVDGRIEIREAPISKIPRWGERVGNVALTFSDLIPCADLLRVFDQIEHLLHTTAVDKTHRYQVLLQLILAKINDEWAHANSDGPLDFQDFRATLDDDASLVAKMDRLLQRAVKHYRHHLPTPVPDRFDLPAEGLRRLSQLLAPFSLLASKKEVIQSFYMKFAKNLYKWDLAQYFTPHEVIDFIVETVNPRLGETLKDPACGSADFLVSAFRHAVGEATNVPGDFIFGCDNSPQAVQVSKLNMLLNGDGKTNITEEDSLEAFNASAPQFDVLLCNPPFGVKIVETRREVLQKFALGHRWQIDAETGEATQTTELLAKQETGLLFAELCVRSTLPGGRLGIILPNGYLGNTSWQYRALREWLVRHTKIVAVVGFPRFTFKKAGADVSAATLILERRATPLPTRQHIPAEEVFFEMVTAVGWRIGDKKGGVLHRRDPRTGKPLLDDQNRPLIDSDLPDVHHRLLRSSAGVTSRWLLEGKPGIDRFVHPTVPITEILADPRVVLDPKRWCPKYRDVVAQITARDHYRIGDVARAVHTKRPPICPTDPYRYVEIAKMGRGEYDFVELQGWNLPDRARIPCQPGDLFVASIWSSVGKWFIAGEDAAAGNLLVTSGCTRLVVDPPSREVMIDLIAGLSSEAFRTQARAVATGSDGLATIAPTDLLDIVLPRVTAPERRRELAEIYDRMLASRVRISRLAEQLCREEGWPEPRPRKAHWVLV